MPGMPGMGNMQNMMRQMKKMQKEMGTAQEELNATDFEGTSAQDLVTVRINGAHKMTGIEIKAEAIDPDDPDMVGDLVLEAVNAALTKVDAETQKKMGKYTRGLGM